MNNDWLFAGGLSVLIRSDVPQGGCQAVGSELHRSPPAAMEDGKSRLHHWQGGVGVQSHLHTYRHTYRAWRGVTYCAAHLEKVGVFTQWHDQTNQSNCRFNTRFIYCNFSARIWPSWSQPIWQEQLQALYLFCQRTHSHLTQIQDGTKAHLMGTCPACTVCRCHLFHAQKEMKTSSQLATRLLHQKIVCIFVAFTPNKQKPKTKILSVTSVQ